MSGRLIDWFDEHGRKHYDPWAKRWVQDDLIPPVPAEGQTGVPVFDLTNVALLIDRDGDPIRDAIERVEGDLGVGIVETLEKEKAFAAAQSAELTALIEESNDLLARIEAARERADEAEMAALAAELKERDEHQEAVMARFDATRKEAESKRAESASLLDMAYRDAFPNVRPPYRWFWCETAMTLPGTPTVRMGWAVSYIDHAEAVANGDPDGCPQGAVHLVAKLYARADARWRHAGPVCWGAATVTMREDGTITIVQLHDLASKARSDLPDEARRESHNTLFTHLDVLLLGLSLMNARNIVQVAERPCGQTKKRARRGLPPEREVRVLRLDGRFAQRVASSPDGEASGTKRRHTYRGHWKEYGMKPGQGLLFGKYRCRVYVPDGQRGAADLGVVDKRYVVVPWPKG